LISCIVPVFNGERYLKEALDSILAQTYRPLQILVVDDGSTDRSAPLVASYGDQLRYLWEPNAGQAAARNLGLGEARGEFVAFLDQDDLWHPEKLARQMARFQDRPELDLCVTHVRQFWSPELDDVPPHLLNNPRVMQAIPGYALGALLARRAIFDTVGPFDSSLPIGEDTDWFLRAVEHGVAIEVLPDLLMYRRLHQTNRSWRSAVPASTDRAIFAQIVKASLDRRRRLNPSAPPPLERPRQERTQPTRTPTWADRSGLARGRTRATADQSVRHARAHLLDPGAARGGGALPGSSALSDATRVVDELRSGAPGAL
jgi:glycosyltransferase involved in cell wall biosynthesis